MIVPTDIDGKVLRGGLALIRKWLREGMRPLRFEDHQAVGVPGLAPGARAGGEGHGSLSDHGISHSLSSQ